MLWCRQREIKRGYGEEEEEEEEKEEEEEEKEEEEVKICQNISR